LIVAQAFRLGNRRIRETLGSTDDRPTPPEQHKKALFADQAISILKLIVDRIGDTDAILIKVDIGENLYSLARFIHQSPKRASEFRIKARFCALIDIVLQKREALRMRQEVAVRNNLLETITDWILESSSVRSLSCSSPNCISYLKQSFSRNGQMTSLAVTKRPAPSVTLI
jgi:hypothetical protein